MSRQREEKMVEPPALRDHPQRRILSAEVHARPYMRLLAPARASLLALYTEEEGAEEERRLLTELCRSRGAAGPGEEANFHLVELEDFTLRWERHTEFSTYGFFAPQIGRAFFPSADSTASHGRHRLILGISRNEARCSIGWWVGPSSPRPMESWV